MPFYASTLSYTENRYMKILMINNMNDLYKIQYKCKKKIVHEKLQYQIRHVASFMKVVWGGGNLIQIFLASIKKKDPQIPVS